MNLYTLGFGPFFESQLHDTNVVVARVAAEHRGAYTLWTTEGEQRAHLAGRLRHRVDGPLPGVGDWVELDPATGVIRRVLERRTLFTRGAAGREAEAQVIAANVDIVFIVTALDDDYSLHRIERYLARVWASGAQPVVVLTKSDLCSTVSARVLEVESVAIGVEVIATAALDGEGLGAVRAQLGAGLTGALVGSSGAGKSTLVNALAGEALMRTSEVRASDSKGRHTTTHRQLLRLPGGGLLIDTPGMRELQLADEDGLDDVFADVTALADGCRFRDCGHHGEPGCAVQAAIDAGELEADRLAHFLQLQAEAQAYEIRHDERQRRAADRALGKFYAQAQASARRFKQGFD